MASSRSFNTLYDIANAVIANWILRSSTIKGTKENWLRTYTFLHDLLRMDTDLVDWSSSTCALTVGNVAQNSIFIRLFTAKDRHFRRPLPGCTSSGSSSPLTVPPHWQSAELEGGG